MCKMDVFAGNFIIGFPGETVEDVLENIHV